MNFDQFSNEITLTPSKSLKDKLPLINNKYLIVQLENRLIGVKINTNSSVTPNNKINLISAWNFNIPTNHTLIERKTNLVNDYSESAYQSNGKIFYKFLDRNIELVLINSDNKSLIINVLRATNGKVLHQNIIHGVDFTQTIISEIEENIIVISYARKDKVIPRNELFIIEILKRDIEYSIFSL